MLVVEIIPVHGQSIAAFRGILHRFGISKAKSQTADGMGVSPVAQGHGQVQLQLGHNETFSSKTCLLCSAHCPFSGQEIERRVTIYRHSPQPAR